MENTIKVPSRKVVAFLPCRSGSQRVPKKNIKPIAHFDYGLIQIKINQLIEANMVDSIFLSTNDQLILEYASSIKSAKLCIHRRSEDLCTNATSTDDLILHASKCIPNAHILWTHVTSPFVSSKCYDKLIKSYFEALSEGYDSLMTTSLIRNFVWNDSAPLNYNRTIEKWPRTQTLPRLYEVNSAAFIASSIVYNEFSDRIGKKPLLYVLDQFKSFDVDWPDDFTFAEQLIKSDIIEL
ncbi:cytidylyltransferase domain-containing protein [Synechococcus sp. ROS8604]|uniref:acylneuraminate cytidylyltransferase family protein n=1 Tax=Synechococcus sp. ROS8604 TaxID=1442557 RepID=UPI001649459F|nr:acylneuraminate cytidylyltransferase family protein [Synechococcus sp. ROS8604]QNI86962.1 N-acylneuraminate cytidylyltransferase [Synechococcus sp. ROS8604]